MFYTTVYFVFAYGFIWVVVLAIDAVLRQLKTRPGLGAAIKVLLLLVPLLPYGRVAAQTAIYKKPMLNEVRKALASMEEQSDDIVTFRILNINSSRAEVYIVQPCGAPKDRSYLRSSTMFYFKHTTKGWDFDTYSSPWSDCGSAEGNTFPPYLDADEF